MRNVLSVQRLIKMHPQISRISLCYIAQAWNEAGPVLKKRGREEEEREGTDRCEPFLDAPFYLPIEILRCTSVHPQTHIRHIGVDAVRNVGLREDEEKRREEKVCQDLRYCVCMYAYVCDRDTYEGENSDNVEQDKMALKVEERNEKCTNQCISTDTHSI